MKLSYRKFGDVVVFMELEHENTTIDFGTLNVEEVKRLKEDVVDMLEDLTWLHNTMEVL